MGGAGRRSLAPHEPLGNALLRRCGALARHLDQVRVGECAYHEAPFGWCHYGRPWRKSTRLAG
eukprot:6006699-Alexandrium_andersonii.AAC.1